MMYDLDLKCSVLTDFDLSLLQWEPSIIGTDGRSYYRWIMDLILKTQMTVTYTPGRSSSSSLESRMNAEADHYPSSSQRIVCKLPTFPSLTFYMNDYTFFREGDGFIESNIPHFIDTYSDVTTNFFK